MKAGVIIFPGSNCDSETVRLLEHMEMDVQRLWHKDPAPKLDLYVLPGGFSYGDYMRAGALATYSPIMQDIKKYADDGRKILGICNGFQILCEAGILPGTLTRNDDNKFYCGWMTIRNGLKDHYYLPLANKIGKYYSDHRVNVAYRYATMIPSDWDDLEVVAGVYNEKCNVLGMMPHPERAFEQYHASGDGVKVINNFVNL